VSATKSRPTVYLVDASSYVYRAFFALPPLTSPSGLPTNAVYGFSTMLLKLLREIAPTYLAAVFDAPGPTFRDELFAAYKANRPSMPDDLAVQLPLIHDLVAAFRVCSLALPGVEADDVIGTLCARMTVAQVDTMVISGDKDLMQLVGPHVRVWDTMRDKVYDESAVHDRWGVAPEQIVEIMGLMGDPIDNIPGIKGIGEKTALALIERYGNIEGVLSHLDELEAAKEIRGAKKLAAVLRADAETARLSRQLAVVRRDVQLEIRLEDLRCHSPDTERLRAIFTELGFQSLLRDLTATAPVVAVPLRPVTDAAFAAAVASDARAHRRMALACVAAGGPEGHQQAAGLVVSTSDDESVYVSLSDSASAAVLLTLLREENLEKVVHDWKRDLLLLGDPVAPIVDRSFFDVMIASYLLEASATHRLEDLAADTLSRRLASFRDDAASVANGVSLLGALRDCFAPRLHAQGMENLFYEVEMPLVGVLADMERRGVRLDVAALAEMSRELESRLVSLEQEIYALAGGPFNIASPPQLREVLFDRLGLPRKGVKRGKTGLSTDIDVLTRLAAAHPLPAKILEYRGVAKLKSTYVDALPRAVNPKTGRLHTSFNQTVAATGRLSSSDPNLQNIPIRSEDGRRIRAAFIARDRHLLVVADYSQIELRLLAHLSADPVLVAAFTAGDDVHARTAAEVFGVLPGAVTADMRRAAKVINFGIIYGMGPQRLARELTIPLAEAERYISGYFERYAGIRDYLEATRNQARACGYVTTLLGRRRRLPDLVSRDRAAAQAAERTAVNTPIQGSAADLIKLAMVAIDRRVRREGIEIAMLLQVHDELVFEVAESQAEYAKALIRDEMEGVYPLQVPLRVEIAIGRNWAEAH
jgi:DNA polymerase-1